MVGKKKYNSIVLLGPTASGKTGLGVHLALSVGGEILSADSRQVYRGLDIGSGKDLSEYGDIPYHLIDVASLPDEYSVFSYQKDFYRIFPEVISRGRVPVIVGGTGMYLDSVIRGYDFADVAENPRLREELAGLSLSELIARLLSLKAEIHNRTDLEERPRLVRAIEIAEHKRSLASSASAFPAGTEGRPDIKPLILGIRFERSVLRERIKARLEARIAEGLIGEVKALHENGISWERLERLGLEYRATAEFLQGRIGSQKEWADGLYISICQFAKRQETWFRGMERKGVEIVWIDGGSREIADAIAVPAFA